MDAKNLINRLVAKKLGCKTRAACNPPRVSCDMAPGVKLIYDMRRAPCGYPGTSK